MPRGPRKKPYVVQIAPRVQANFDAERPDHYTAAWFERMATVGKTIASRKARGTTRVELTGMARRHQMTVQEVEAIELLVDCAFFDHANGRRLAPYTAGVAGPPGD